MEGFRAPTKAVFRRAVGTIAVVILYAGMMSFPCEERSPHAQVCVVHMIVHGTYDLVVSVIEG